MSRTGMIKGFLRKNKVPVEMPVEEAYDTWALSYDEQPGNLMLDLDEIIFSSLLQKLTVENKILADIGCGTGRHWEKLYKKKPASLTGYDVSSRMLDQLLKKFPAADVHHNTDNLLKSVPAASVDCIISTLTVAHIQNISEAITAWARIIKAGGDIIVTDFHPATLGSGGRRSFKHENKNLCVENYVHPLPLIKDIFLKNGFCVIQQEERFIDEAVKHYYDEQGAAEVYRRFNGLPVIYGLHLKKNNAAA